MPTQTHSLFHSFPQKTSLHSSLISKQNSQSFLRDPKMSKSTTAVIAKKNIKSSSLAPSPLHPPYFEMICDAITALKERNGSSQQAIAKFMDEKHSGVLPPNFKKLLSVQLKKFVKSERLFKVKNSFKISPTGKKKKKDLKPIAPKDQKSNPAGKIQANMGAKTKRLSQVQTPEGTKKSGIGGAAKAGKKTKLLSQVKTPEGLKRKAARPIESSRASKRARK